MECIKSKNNGVNRITFGGVIGMFNVSDSG